MTAMLLTFGAFAVWTFVGLGLLASLRADMRSLVLVLTSPVLGVSLITMIALGLSRAGLAVEDFAVPATAALLIASAAVLAWRRPLLEWSAALPYGVALGAMVLAGWPMFDLGFRWIANANDDMANYVLAAERLFRHGFSAPLNVDQFVAGRDYTVAAQSLQAVGGRPGSQLTLAWLQGVSGRSGQGAFMPLILALHGCCVCAVGALAAQVTRRRVVTAVLAAALLALAPLAIFGVMQQLIAQTFGLGIGASLAAVLMRRELHERNTSVTDIALVGLLTGTLALVYVEIGVMFFIAYLAFVVALAARRRVRWQPLTKLWGSALLVALLLLNTYAVSLGRFLGNQAHAGTATSGDPPLFGFIFVPSAVPAVVGLQRIPFEGFDHISFWIASGIVLLALVVAVMFITALRGHASAFVLLAGAAIAVVLVINRADFGLFKLAMYVQPFIAATVAIAIVSARRHRLQLGAAVLLLLWLVPAVQTGRAYVDRSRNPTELRHGSAETVFPAFGRAVRSSQGPLISATTNPVLAKLEASTALGHRLLFVAREFFRPLMEQRSDGGESSAYQRQTRMALQRSRWASRVFVLPASNGDARHTNLFAENHFATAALDAGGCVLVIASGSQETLNRRRLPDGTPDLIFRPCASVQNVLIFVNSKLGQSYYLPSDRRNVSFYQLENDVYFPGHTFSAAGRYALFQVLRPSKDIRLCIDLTRTLARDRANLLPPVTIAANERATFQLVGRGSARACSTPVSPQRIASQSYVMLDMGIDAKPPNVPRPGLLRLFGRGFPIDPRYLTSYVRDVSVITEAAYQRFEAPLALRSFPQALEDNDLEYSGIYEDGWVGERSYALLAAGPASELVVEGDAFDKSRRLVVSVDGKLLAARRVGPGVFKVHVHASGSSRRRRVELRFSSITFLPDGRPIAARLLSLGFARR